MSDLAGEETSMLEPHPDRNSGGQAGLMSVTVPDITHMTEGSWRQNVTLESQCQPAIRHCRGVGMMRCMDRDDRGKGSAAGRPHPDPAVAGMPSIWTWTIQADPDSPKPSLAWPRSPACWASHGRSSSARGRRPPVKQRPTGLRVTEKSRCC